MHTYLWRADGEMNNGHAMRLVQMLPPRTDDLFRHLLDVSTPPSTLVPRACISTHPEALVARSSSWDARVWPNSQPHSQIPSNSAHGPRRRQTSGEMTGRGVFYARHCHGLQAGDIARNSVKFDPGRVSMHKLRHSGPRQGASPVFVVPGAGCHCSWLAWFRGLAGGKYRAGSTGYIDRRARLRPPRQRKMN